MGYRYDHYFLKKNSIYVVDQDLLSEHFCLFTVLHKVSQMGYQSLEYPFDQLTLE